MPNRCNFPCSTYGIKEKAEQLDKAVDEIRRTFGAESIMRGTFANSEIKPIQGGVNDSNHLMMGGYR